jgi:hypothetical protein
MRRFIPCPWCGERLTAPEGAAPDTESVLCPRCGGEMDCAALAAPVNRTDERIMPAVPRPVGSTAANESGTEEGEEPLALEPRKTRAARPMRRRKLPVTALAVAALVLVAAALAYRVTLDLSKRWFHHNPSLTAESWAQIQTGMTLEQVEEVVGKGQPCPMADVKVAVDEQAAIFKNAQAFGPGWPSAWDNVDDLPNQEVRQGVTSWYRWQDGNTFLFVGVGRQNEVRIACLLRRLAQGGPGGASWRFTVDPYGKGAVEPTGKSAKATLADELVVEQYIRQAARNPAAVEIAQWGPHDLTGEVRTVPGYELRGERRQKPVVKLRVRYWTQDPDEKVRLKDLLFYMQDEEVFGSYPNPYGDRWIDVLRQVEGQLHRGR